jgi:hypothetical protein
MFVTAIELGAVETRHDDNEPTFVCGRRSVVRRAFAARGQIK